MLIILLLILLGFFWVVQRRSRNLPPGPMGLPIIGNLHQIGAEPHKTFIRFRKAFGDIFSLRFGAFRVVVLNEYSLVKKAFHMAALSGRPGTETMIDTHHGIIFTQGRTWSEQRKFVLKTLRDFGLGKRSMEGLIQEELNEVIKEFRETAGKSQAMSNRFNVPVLNALWAIVSGERYAHDDPRLVDLVNRMSSDTSSTGAADPLSFFPIVGRVRRLMPTLFSRWAQERAENAKTNIDFMKESIEKHSKAIPADGDFQDLIEAYLSEVGSTTDPESSFYKQKGIQNLEIVLRDLFLAGAETSSYTLSWTCLLLALHPEIQEKLHEEIKGAAGMGRLPSLEDRPILPYTESVIMEVMRFRPLVPLGAFHSALEDTPFDNYVIPEGTIISSNLYCILQDPAVWGDPENFRPSRFLSQDGTKALRHEALIPFSTGKRVCLGESLARDELFLFVSGLFQNFRVVPDPEGPISLDYYKAALLPPKPHRLVFHSR